MTESMLTYQYVVKRQGGVNVLSAVLAMKGYRRTVITAVARRSNSAASSALRARVVPAALEA